MEGFQLENKIAVTFINGEKRDYPKGIALLEIANEIQGAYRSPIVAAKVNNQIKDLEVTLEEDCILDFLDLHTDDGIKVYQRSLTFVMITAIEEIFPHGNVTVEHSLSKGLYCELYLGRELTKDDLTLIENRMRQIINENRAIVKKVLPVAEAILLFEQAGHTAKANLLRQLKRDQVTLYFCGKVYDYLYGTMVLSTGILKLFELRYYKPGLILRFPEKENPNLIPEYVEQPKLAEIFAEAERWGTILDCGYVSTLNQYIQNNEFIDIIRVAEALHEKKIAQIADFVSAHRNEVRVILVAGPSSSGKTTFAQRLNIQLRVNGVRPVPISLDDYFVDRAHTPRDEKGDYDFEAIEAIDLELFNRHLSQMLDGEEVEIPFYNFLTGQREYRGHKIRIGKEQPLIIEGIHGLNERLTSSVARENKVKIYISALTQLSIDHHNRIPTTDGRLIRRIVRDSQFRGHDAIKSLKIWPSVRRGEERNIFPFQEEADIMFNSALIYELAVLKPYAEPLLEKVSPAEPEYAEAKRLLNFLAYFEPILADDDIPTNSILKEFIGRSCFYKP
jgi:uridine kinase